MSSSKTIAKNSLFLYIRMFINMLVGLFTAGIVLNTLGITDYGIYNIVGGFVSMFGFLNASMSQATQRFLSFDLGKNDKEQLRKTFSTAVTIHLAIALLIVAVLETFGLWYINHKLNVPASRLYAVNIVFQFSVFSSFFGIIQVPYNALITAHERFNVYAYISFVEIAFKLVILFLIVHVHYDKLILYSFLLFCSSFIIRMIYRVSCRRNFPESQYQFYFDKTYFKTLLSFTGWNLFGNIAATARGQGNNLVLNWFFGTTMNAAYGITMMVQGVISSFVSNFQAAVNPQIIKNYSAGNKEQSFKLMQQSAKFSFGLMMLMAMPIMASLTFILDHWLKHYPHISLLFIKLTLINILIDTLSNPLMMGLQATGKIKAYQAIVGFLIFLNLPISYVLIKITNHPEVVFTTSIVISSIAIWLRLYFLKKQMGMDIDDFLRKVIAKVVLLSGIVGVIVYGISFIYFFNEWSTFFVKSILLVFCIAFLVYYILFNEKEKNNLKFMIFKKTGIGK